VSDLLTWSAGLPEVTHLAGSVVLQEGVVHGLLFVLVDGAVEVSRMGIPITVVDHPGAIFGEMSALIGGPATATVTAVRDSRLRRSDDPHGFLGSHPGVGNAVATVLARRLDTITRYLMDLRSQYADHGQNLAMVDTVLESLRHHQVRDVDPGSDRQREAPY
jgi:CRP/FNR family transcriptional regulator, cyclic AMP receptor protein